MSAPCRWVVGEIAKMETRRAASFLQLHRERARQRREDDARQAAFELLLRRRERRQNLRYLARLKDSHPALGAAVAINLPCGVRTEAPIGRERLERYRGHLTSLVARARASEGLSDWAWEQSRGVESRLLAQDVALAARPGMRATTESLCRMCEGGCCTSGGDHAYLTEYEVLRLLSRRPDWTDEQVVAAFVAHVPEKGRTNSCINHTAQGCALPRELRSDVCNVFFCDDIKRLHSDHPDGDAPPVLAIQREYHQWNRMHQGPHARIIHIALLHEGKVEPRPLRPPRRTTAKPPSGDR